MSDWIKKKEEKEEKPTWIKKKEEKKNWITKKDPADIQDRARTSQYKKGGRVKKKSSGKAIRGKGCEIK